MSRSRRKTPIIGITTCESEKKDKRIANRIFRRKTKEAVKKNKSLPYSIKETSDTWSFGKDGKQFLKSTSTELRK